MKYLKHGLTAALAIGTVALGSGVASAMPNGLPSASAVAPSPVESVRWVCGPYRCWWRPGPYGYYGPRPWRPGWGWRRWHYWHRW
jgi:hypothetical protein